MSNRINVVFAAMTLLALGAWIGCKPAPAPNAGGSGTAKEEHHEGDGHEHDGEHAAEGPHHGHLIELGEEEYHAELTHDEATKAVSIYLLDSSAKTAVPIADAEVILNLVVDGKPLQAKLAAAPQEGDPSGQASCFTSTDEAVLEALEAPKTTGRLNVTIAGKSYTGVVEHSEHGEHGHEHD